MEPVLALTTDPAAWAALAALSAMAVVLGIDTPIFLSIPTKRLPEHQRPRASPGSQSVRAGLLGHAEQAGWLF